MNIQSYTYNYSLYCDFEIAGKDISYRKLKLWCYWGNYFMKYQDEYLFATLIKMITYH